MKLRFEIASEEAAAVRQFYEKWRTSPLVVARQRRNVEGDRKPLTEASAWDTLVACLLTTQQRSGPNAPITNFIRRRPFPLGLELARQQPNVAAWVVEELSAHRGIRRYNTLARDIARNFEVLEDGGFGQLMKALRELEQPHPVSDERRVARLVDAMLAGVGPKQARNFLQILGLTQYEVPLDSRVAKWLRTFDFPVPVSAAALSDPDYYDFALDGFQQVAAASDVIPCLLDAAIFASYDPAWSEAEVVF